MRTSTFLEFLLKWNFKNLVLEKVKGYKLGRFQGSEDTGKVSRPEWTSQEQKEAKFAENMVSVCEDQGR